MAASGLTPAIRKASAEELTTNAAFVRKRILAVLDQGLFAGSNFIINILLARLLTPFDYGAFTLAFSLILLVGTIHTAVITEPMMVFGPGKFHRSIRKYWGLLIAAHFIVVLPICIVLACSGVVMSLLRFQQIGITIISAAAFCSMILLLWLARRAYYALLNPAPSVAGGVFYLGCVVSLLWLLTRESLVSPSTGFAAMGFCSLVVSIGLFAFLRPSWSTAEEPSARRVYSEHWKYGRWSLSTAILNWIPDNIFCVLLPIWIGLGAVGALRAAVNLVMPMAQAIAAMSLVLMPVLVNERALGGLDAMGRAMRHHGSLLLVAYLPYSCLLVAGRRFILHFFYATKYDDLGVAAFVWTSIIPINLIFVTTVGNGLRAIERPDAIFRSYLGATAVSLLVGVPLGVMFGVTGALAGLCMTSGVAAILMWWQYRTLVLLSPSQVNK